MKGRALLITLAVTTGLGVVAGLAIRAAGPFAPPEPAAGAAPGPATATIVRSDLVSRIVLDATVGYTGAYTVGYPAATASSLVSTATSTGTSSHPPSAARPSGTSRPAPPARTRLRASGGGTVSAERVGPSSGRGPTPSDVTALPRIGQVVSQGQALFAVNGTPTVLLYGSIPAWRTLAPGAIGPDVAALNADLVALGAATAARLDPAGDTYSAATAAAVTTIQTHLGTPRTGTLSLGQAAFEPTPMRVTSVSATLGGPVPAGGPMLTGTSTTRVITAAIDASQRSELHVSDAVTITLADGTTTPGKVATIGTDATEPSSTGPGDTTPPPTVAVVITPADPAATGTVDQAPLIVAITIAGVHDALAIPAAAIVTTSGGHPAINVLDPAGATHAVPVTLGIFDDASGLVQVSGPGVRAGETISLPAQLTTRA